LRHRHGLPVRTVVVLLRRSAGGPRVTGLYQDRLPGEPPYLRFRYGVVRVWREPADTFLSGGLGVVPLALLSAAPEPVLPGVLRQMEERIKREAPPARAAKVRTMCYLLAGVRLPWSAVHDLFEGVLGMLDLSESSTYQKVMRDGMVKGIHRLLLTQGRLRFGAPTKAARAALESVDDPDRLEALGKRLLTVASWDELLGTNGTK
jgi:hypothetical protein